MPEYHEALIAHLEESEESIKNYEVDTIYFGGGTPSFYGADRIAANGDTANKIGSLSLAVNAKHFGVPFYVFAPRSTFDPKCKTGEDIPIELREGSEISTLHFERPIAPEGVRCLNPAFDVVPHELITAIVTEEGVLSVNG